jgi:hypothetical protein
MRDQSRLRLRKTDLLTERSESWPAFLERKKLCAQERSDGHPTALRRWRTARLAAPPRRYTNWMGRTQFAALALHYSALSSVCPIFAGIVVEPDER